jgi:uncharacterized repeat protein (TIGR03843 family)
VLELLGVGELEVVGRITGASNATLLAVVTLGDVEQAVVYKPVDGERPLWDFPDGTLAGREVAAWLVSDAGGWGVVPPTVLREGPFGLGSVQQWVGAEDGRGTPVAAEPGEGLVDALPPHAVPPGWLTVVRGSGYAGEAVVLAHADDPALRAMSLFDAVANNADRKGGHVLRAGPGAGHAAGRVLGVDHGLAFHAEPKLRTVLWGWGGRRLDDEGVARLEATAAALDPTRGGGLRDDLSVLLTRRELAALDARVAALRERCRHPRPGPGGPSLPWPLF